MERSHSPSETRRIEVTMGINLAKGLPSLSEGKGRGEYCEEGWRAWGELC